MNEALARLIGAADRGVRCLFKLGFTILAIPLTFWALNRAQIALGEQDWKGLGIYLLALAAYVGGLWATWRKPKKIIDPKSGQEIEWHYLVKPTPVNLSMHRWTNATRRVGSGLGYLLLCIFCLSFAMRAFGNSSHLEFCLFAAGAAFCGWTAWNVIWFQRKRPA